MQQIFFFIGELLSGALLYTDDLMPNIPIFKDLT